MSGVVVLVAFVLVIAIVVWRGRRAKKPVLLPASFRGLLEKHIRYYRVLNEVDKRRFEAKLTDVLSYVKIHGVGTEVELLDRLLIAASAVIPVFGYENWHYYNIRDVLLYGEAFERDNFAMGTEGRNTAGMVGSGALQQIMILSKPDLRHGFADPWGRYNTGIHEFVHLLDKADGDTDGFPEQLLRREDYDRWKELSAEEIKAITAGTSDIDPYAATTPAEFFAVISEYFFQRPDLMQERHPELFEILCGLFRQHPRYDDIGALPAGIS